MVNKDGTGLTPAYFYFHLRGAWKLAAHIHAGVAGSGYGRATDSVVTSAVWGNAWKKYYKYS